MCVWINLWANLVSYSHAIVHRSFIHSPDNFALVCNLSNWTSNWNCSRKCWLSILLAIVNCATALLRCHQFSIVIRNLLTTETPDKYTPTYSSNHPSNIPQNPIPIHVPKRSHYWVFSENSIFDEMYVYRCFVTCFQEIPVWFIIQLDLRFFFRVLWIGFQICAFYENDYISIFRNITTKCLLILAMTVRIRALMHGYWVCCRLNTS